MKILESYDIGAVLNVAQEIELDAGDGEQSLLLPVGSFLVISDEDNEDGTLYVDAYDENSNSLAEGIAFEETDLDDLMGGGFLEAVSDDSLQIEDESYVMGGTVINEVVVKFTHGKVKRFKLKSKKGFKRVGSKYVKIAATTLAKMKRTGAKMGRKPKKASAIRLQKKSSAKRRKVVHEGVETEETENIVVIEGEEFDAEELGFSVIYDVNEAFVLEAGDKELEIKEGYSFVTGLVDEGDNAGHISMTILDGESNIVEEDVCISDWEINALTETGACTIVEDDSFEIIESEGQVNEITWSVRGGKVKKFALKAKAGFKRVGTHYVRLSNKARSALRRVGAKMGRKVKRASSMIKMHKSMLIRKRKGFKPIHASYTVGEAFDITYKVDDVETIFPTIKGDVLNIEETGESKTVSILRGTENVATFEIDNDFETSCISEGLILAGEDVSDKFVDSVKEGKEVEDIIIKAKLSYDSNKGYILESGDETKVLGNRVRARAVLLNEGYDVSAKVLESAFNGKVTELN